MICCASHSTSRRERIEGVQVVFASDVGTLDLHALASSDKHALRGILLMLVPADPAEWPRVNVSQSSCASDRDGACSISRAPGDYLVIPIASGVRLDNLEAVIRERAANATRATLRANERRTLEVSVPDGK